MEISSDVQLLLSRCRAMNCVYEGQSFSRSLLSNACADPEKSGQALEEMIEKGLAVKTPTGAYSLTAIGASTLQSTTSSTKNKAFSRTTHQNRPPINKI